MLQHHDIKQKPARDIPAKNGLKFEMSLLEWPVIRALYELDQAPPPS